MIDSEGSGFLRNLVKSHDSDGFHKHQLPSHLGGDCHFPYWNSGSSGSEVSLNADSSPSAFASAWGLPALASAFPPPSPPPLPRGSSFNRLAVVFPRLSALVFLLLLRLLPLLPLLRLLLLPLLMPPLTLPLLCKDTHGYPHHRDFLSYELLDSALQLASIYMAVSLLFR